MALGSSCGLAGIFPDSCMTSWVSGQAWAGVLSSLARIVSLVLGEEPEKSGLTYFLLADAFLIATLIGYTVLRKMVSRCDVGCLIEKCLIEENESSTKVTE